MKIDIIYVPASSSKDRRWGDILSATGSLVTLSIRIGVFVDT